jgi:hypothetical protein
MIDNIEVGEISLEVINLLGLPLSESTPIYVGVTNIAHMAKEHSYEFNRFYDRLSFIISMADYVRLKEDDGSIEYIKSFGNYIKLAVRVAGDGKYYARSLYFIETNRVENLVKKGELKKLTKS